MTESASAAATPCADKTSAVSVFRPPARQSLARVRTLWSAGSRGGTRENDGM